MIEKLLQFMISLACLGVVVLVIVVLVRAAGS